MTKEYKFKKKNNCALNTGVVDKHYEIPGHISKRDALPEPLISIFKKEWWVRAFLSGSSSAYFFNSPSLRPTQSHLSVFFAFATWRKQILFTDVIHFYLTSHGRALSSLIIRLRAAQREALVKMFWFRRRAYIILLFLRAPERGMSFSRPSTDQDVCTVH
jgi:hypothetical protein